VLEASSVSALACVVLLWGAAPLTAGDVPLATSGPRGAGEPALGTESTFPGAGGIANYTPLMASARVVAAGCVGTAWQVTFNASASGGVPPYNYSWKFGDSSGAVNQQDPTHAYAGFGTYTAWATAWDRQGHHNAAPVSVSTQHCGAGGNGTWYSPPPGSSSYWLLVGGLVVAVLVSAGVAIWALRTRRRPPAAETPRGEAAADYFE
jgi:hypothetical protein